MRGSPNPCTSPGTRLRRGASSVLAAAGVLFGALALASPAAAQRLDSGSYEQLLAETREGLFITSGRALAAYPADSVASVVGQFIASGPEPVRLKAAALLHTEAAFLSNRGSSDQLEFARTLLAALPDPEERTEWLRRWWLAVCSSYQVSLNSVAGVAAYEAALEDLPGDRAIRESFASMLQMVGRQREELPYLRRAAEVLAEFLEETPDDVPMRVRIAGVALDLGEPEIATQHLDRLGDARLPGMTRLAALLIRGEIALGAERFAEAEAAFAEAVRRARRSPAAVSGLVTARLALGDRAGAAEAARTLLDRQPTGWEPEWRYWLGDSLDFQEMFQEMKDEVREAQAAGGAE